MSISPTHLSSAGCLPAGYKALPIDPAASHWGLVLCIVVRVPPDALGGAPVPLRTEPDALVWLGALMDRGGRVHRWVEWVVQSMSAWTKCLSFAGEAGTNLLLDRRWQNVSRMEVESMPGLIVETGAESKHPLALWFDPATSSVRPLLSTAGESFALCTDDSALEKAGLPLYRSTSHRYLWSNKEAPFIPVTPGAPINASTRNANEVEPAMKGWIPLNPEGGLCRVRGFLPLSYTEALSVLDGQKWEGIRHGRSQIAVDPAAPDLAAEDSPRRLFFTALGTPRALPEIFHIKIQFLLQACRTVAQRVQAVQSPLFTINEDFFRVGFSDAPEGTPLFWNARVIATGHGAAVPLPVQSAQISCFQPPPSEGFSIYRPAAGEGGRTDSAVLRIRSVTETDKGLAVIQGTVRLGDGFPLHPRHLVWMRLSLGARMVDLYGSIEEDSALARGEARFRSYDMTLDPALIALLNSAAGVPIESVSIASRPLYSTPSDLHALGVLAVRTLLVNDENTLPVALDEMLSLAREAGAIATDAATLPSTIASLMKSDPRWRKSLGPHRLSPKMNDPLAASAAVPADMWAEALAAIARMFPGASPLSVCKGFDEGRPGTYHHMFMPCVEAWETLSRKTRGLILSDWNSHREIHSVLDKIKL